MLTHPSGTALDSFNLLLSKTFNILEIHLKHKKKNLYCESGQTLSQVAHRGCGGSTLGDIQNPTGHGPGQPALADPA